MRIGFDLRRMHDPTTGRYARNLFASVVAEAPQHEFVAVVRSEKEGEQARVLAGHAANVRVSAAPGTALTLRELLRTPPLDPSVDVWHVPHPLQWSLGARHATVLTIHDPISTTDAGPLPRALARSFLRVACRRAARVISTSSTIAEVFRREVGVRGERVHVTPEALDVAFEAPVAPAAVAAARRRWGLPKHTILYVGRSQPHENLERLLRAVALLARDTPPDRLALAILGALPPRERASLETRINALGIATHVRFLHALAGEEVRAVYHAAGLLAHPPLAEGFASPVLQAMHAHTPVAASDIPALREVAGDAAVYFDPRDSATIAACIRGVLYDPRLADALRERGARNLWRFSWRATARETIRAYEAAGRTRRAGAS